ncbi:MAG: YIP1 family protein, partial [Methanoregula sp.]|nr:YIP1 family protein [Methanoregula sp.]
SKEKVSLIPPLAIVGTGMLFMVLVPSIALIYYNLTTTVHGNPAMFTGQIWYYIRCSAIIPLIIWSVLSLGTYGISHLLHGKGSLAATIQNTGYGMMPWTASVIIITGFSAILFVIAFIVPSTVIFMEKYASFGYALFPYISLIFLFWGWYLWTLAVVHTHGFTFRKAAAILLLPVMIVIWLTIPTQEWIETIQRVISGT